MALTRFSLGVSALLTDPDAEKPGGYCRDEILFAPLDLGAPNDDYEIREVLSADLPMASGSDDDVGDLVVIARPGTGGPLRPDAAKHLLRRWNSTPKRAEVLVELADLQIPGPALLVPDPYGAKQIDWPTFPLFGVHLLPVRPIKQALLERRDVEGERDQALAILRLCAVHRFVVSITAA